MNIGIVTTWAERGAGYVSRAYIDLLRTRHNLFIYGRGDTLSRNDPLWRTENVTWGKYYPNELTFIDQRHFARWITGNKIDVLFFNEQQDWRIIYFLYEKFPSLKLAAYIDYYTQDTVRLFDFYDFLICNTKRHYSVFDQHRQSYYIPWGTDVEVFKPVVNPHGSLTFFHSAGASPFRKGTDLVLRAFNLLQDDGVRLVIHSQEDLAKYFDGATLKLLSHPNVELVVKTVTKPGLYYLGDVYIYPSRLDGLGLTLAEALSCGLPAIAPDASPMNEFVIDGVNGKLVKVEKFISRSDGYYWPENVCSPGDLTDSMRFFVENAHMIDRYKTNARQGAVTALDWRMREEQVNEIFESTEIVRYKVVTRSLIGDLQRYCQKKYMPLSYGLARGFFRLLPESARQYLYPKVYRNGAAK